MIKVGIIGGTGYTGVELLRVLAMHPEAHVTVITSRSEAGTHVAELFPSLRGHVDIRFSTPDHSDLNSCDVVFSATPNGIAMTYAEGLVAAGVRLIDLAADFRLQDRTTWEHWYGMEHACPDLLAAAVYGLPELNRRQIEQARLVANPGCYPTSVALGFMPLLEQSLIDPRTLIADSKSGVSGAGRGAKVGGLLAEISDSFKAYGASGHRHQPEISQTLSQLARGPVGVVFVPHLVPMIRGIHSTLYATLTKDRVDLQSIFEQHYADEPFVDVLPAGSHPDTRSVRGANICRIAVHQPGEGNSVVVLAVIDNLVKGAAGQAVQNMNIMFGLTETMGLLTPPLSP